MYIHQSSRTPLAKKIVYWASTILISAMMVLSGLGMLMTHAKEGYSALGYPSYFPFILGPAKLLGVIALLAPVPRVLKHWAYAGFTFTFISAFISHLAFKDAGHAFGSVLALGLLFTSYLSMPRPKGV
ncbi:MAG: DoxX family protein [Spirochaetes bacterium]|nr:DoxX family protein [Spirochaetota bacterium]